MVFILENILVYVKLLLGVNMKKLILFLLVLLGLGIGVFIYIKIDNNRKYEQISNNFEDALNTYFKVKIKYGYKEEYCSNNGDEIVTSSYLISQGYLKKDNIKDIDNKNYCTAYTKIHGSNECKYVFDKIYIKCKNFVTEGHAGWE